MNSLNAKLLSVAVSPPALNTDGTPKPPNKSKEKEEVQIDGFAPPVLVSAYVGERSAAVPRYERR